MAAFGAWGRTVAAASGCALALSAGAARAQPAQARAQAPSPVPGLFAQFKRVCADNSGDYARTTAAAEIRGWSKLPFPMPIPTGEARLSRKTVRTTSAPGGFGMFFAGEGLIKAGARRLPIQMCAIGAKPAGFAAAVSGIEAWAGQSATPSDGGVRSVRFHQAPTGARAALKRGALQDVVADLGPGTVVSVDVRPQNALTLISYSIIQL